MNVKTRALIAKLSILVGAVLLGGGLFVLFCPHGGFSAAEIRLLIGVNSLIWGAYFLQLSNTQHLRSRLDALEKRIPKSDSDSERTCAPLGRSGKPAGKQSNHT